MNAFEAYEPARSTEHSDGGEIVTRHGVVEWLHTAVEKGASHLIVACDTFDYTDYPIYVMPEQDVHQVEESISSDEDAMQQVMEVYWLGGDLEEQIEAPRSMTYGEIK